MSAFHPDLKAGRFIPRFSVGPRSVALINRIPMKSGPLPDDVAVQDVQVPGPPGAPAVPVRVYRPRAVTGVMPALIWIHGGGMVGGSRIQDETTNVAFARVLGITVVSVEYRLAPQHPAPAAVEDAYAVLSWLAAEAVERRIDPGRIAIGGASAGGGITASLAQLAHDRGEIRPAFQLLVYPMLDDRTVLRTDLDTTNVRVWTPGSNRYGWTAYLGGQAPGDPGVPPYAVPARREDLTGLPPAWIGVGDLDLFHDEDVEYAERLRRSGVDCELLIVDGAFHGFDALFRRKDVSKEFWRAQARALRAALFPAAPADES
ncbi:alpha/beta hydrolase [Cryptosporangium aurantiacum]|uniref:Acetyl esterase/lipase n=1 Tax=Cryptosporangium aurantiacum TaxID=134849 RepID=A0A1M7P8U4_9ACTN|nr:alpha/beta hydrolase [Cryptosporangium aurantiacum]SHN13113.1 Acetyl esterase/lipase [Cryptosporangium aurantiacum]